MRFTRADAKPGWVPPRSPYTLIQEDLFTNEWRVLVFCVLLNCTKRKQVESIWDDFMLLAPSPAHLLALEPYILNDVVAPLGFRNRRTDRLIAMSHSYLYDEWDYAEELAGIGEYAGTSWEIFCLGRFRDTRPNDGVLGNYWDWYRANHT